LGIGLRLRDVPATVWETGQYPRHRVCGEVLSGRGCDILDHLGVQAEVWKVGARPAETTVFFSEHRRTPVHVLDQSALCLARYDLDALLAKRFRALGGELCEGKRWENQTSSPGLVRASGRPAHPSEGGWRWFGVKAHFRNVTLDADVEMHVFDSGYVGLCRLSQGRVNVCGLFRRALKETEPRPSRLEWLRGPEGSALRDRLDGAQWDEASFCAVAGLPLRPRQAQDSSIECRLGDALTMISPVTGNGMSMALEAAELAVPILTAYSYGQCDWSSARQRVAKACDDRFARRLRIAAWLHGSLFSPRMRGPLLWLAKAHWARQMIFNLTR
jgi:2-polyprenyl-6-methoxyphenol hydroxylase-like FAD-dependent oxidoreductase